MTHRLLLSSALGLAVWSLQFPAAGRADSVEAAGDPSPPYSAAPETAPPEPTRTHYTQLVLDGSYAASGKNTTGDGGGVALRLGRVYPLRYVNFVPEGVLDFFAFSGTRTAQTYGAAGGARMRFARGFEPGLFAHLGVAGVSRGESYAAPTVDVGITADFTYFERLLLGFQGAYKNAFGVGGHAGFSWYTAGISVGTKI